MINLSLEQQAAIDLCIDLKERIVGVTGGAGTGKSTILRHIHGELAKAKSIVLAAPTGRAAKRITELTGIAAKTIHRLLEFPQPIDFEVKGDVSHTWDGPRRSKSNPLLEQVVIVDEASMVGPTLFRQLMDALPAGGVIRFFGDNNQLPPVEEGVPPFIDILERRPSIELTFNFRSEDEIVSNAMRVLQGSLPVRNSRFEILYVADPIKRLLELATGEFRDLSHQIILPTKRANHGSNRVNTSLQLMLNGEGPFLRLNRIEEKEAPLLVRGGDKFLWAKNDYNLELFNGEIGKINWVDEESGSLEIETGERVTHIPPRAKTYNQYVGALVTYDPRKHLELGYAITTHKAQGSEFDTVIYCICSAHAWMLDRRNTYTGITRARKNVIMITDRSAMGRAVKARRAR